MDPLGRRRIEEEAAEGLLLLEHALRLRLKNRVVVDALTSDGGVDPIAWVEFLRRAILDLSEEAAAAAERVRSVARATRFARGSSDHEHDYRSRDRANLVHRARVSRIVVDRLNAWRDDPERLALLLEAAKQDAWEEVARAAEGVVDDRSQDADQDLALVAERLALISDTDLPALRKASHDAARRRVDHTE